MANKLLFLLLLVTGQCLAQISPGDLTRAHANLEGISNCSKCHEVGKKVLSSKCLSCHSEIKALMDKKMGYHASSDVTAKECYTCHNEHHGRNFEIIRFNPASFDHRTAGFVLQGHHARITCQECHRTEHIRIKTSKKDTGSYLGLGTACLDCHADYHQATLPQNCLLCHNQDAFKPATGFDHSKARFQLAGSHGKVDCIKCHRVIEKNGRKAQQFNGLSFSKCTDCHVDVHKGKFGLECRKCHNEESFRTIAPVKGFNHDRTGYPLVGRHRQIDCKACHRQSFKAGLKHARCTDCHKDFHKGQFGRAGSPTDCSECHTPEGFGNTSFSVENHNKGAFSLEGAHLATPCTSCHKKGNEWIFRSLDKRCSGCHKNIHDGFMNPSYLAADCNDCHRPSSWGSISFDHNRTGFVLEGKHLGVSCRKCHFRDEGSLAPTQRFSQLKGICTECHEDSHYGQFNTAEGPSLCIRCHVFSSWKPERFNHDQTRFKLDINHQNVPCAKCHQQVVTGNKRYLQYKTDFKGEIKCIDCHLR